MHPRTEAAIPIPCQEYETYACRVRPHSSVGGWAPTRVVPVPRQERIKTKRPQRRPRSLSLASLSVAGCSPPFPLLPRFPASPLCSLRGTGNDRPLSSAACADTAAAVTPSLPPSASARAGPIQCAPAQRKRGALPPLARAAPFNAPPLD
uniref:Uncharacterized protein n=1 Tax=Setaria italica TaxID=4555 RepID=K3ZAH4_SETIT